MKSIIQGNTILFGSVSAVIAVFCFSTNDVAIKFISKDYALHLVVLILAGDLDTAMTSVLKLPGVRE